MSDGTMVDRDALARTTTIDLTTTGRKSGQPATVEIWWFRVGGRFIITGTPGRRDWYANVLTNPEISIRANGVEFRATARVVDDAKFRTRVFTDAAISWYRSQTELDRLVSEAPMIEVLID